MSVGRPNRIGTYTMGQPQYEVLAEIDAGRLDGLLPGMTLRPPRGSRAEVEVVAVEPEESQVRMIGSNPGKFPATGSVLAVGPD